MKLIWHLLVLGLAFGLTVPAFAGPIAVYDCLCEVTNINPNSTTLRKVATGGKGSDAIRKMNVFVFAVDAPGAVCDDGETSGPVSVNLRMVDDDGGELIDSAKIMVCIGGEEKKATREVLIQSPINCADSAVPDFRSVGVITATGSAPGTPDYVEELTINCLE